MACAACEREATEVERLIRSAGVTDAKLIAANVSKARCPDHR